uniref:uncharacterized protein LOC120335991 n=1 Tax=Styela clava TaxID=7725 RepID=UPI00193A07B9|nr:uncharacterized protein LOC120335991 [Styela clava]
MRWPLWGSEPNGNTNENCLMKYAVANYEWVDTSCTTKSGYICQKGVSSGNCGSDVCLNKGSCMIRKSRYTCTCNAGYFGTKCEKDFITISIAKGKVSLKRGESIDVQLNITSYDGNVNVVVRNQDNVKIKSVTTSNISSSNPSTTLAISIGPIEVSSTTFSYKFEASPQGHKLFYSRVVVLTLVVTDACDSSPCLNWATCQYSTAEPYYNCTCQPEYNGTTCEELKYKFNEDCKYHVNFYKKITFAEANTTCNSLEGAVAMMKTDSIQDFVESQIIDQYGEGGGIISFWIGGYKPNAVWEWLDNTPITDGKWAWFAVSQGNGCLYMSSYATTRYSMKWFNNDGTSKRGYVCEVSTVNLCSPSPCLYWGTCSSIGCQRSCKCLDGFTGNNCETTPISISSTKRNYTANIGESITVTLNIQSNHGLVRIQAFRNVNFNNVILTKRNVGTSDEIKLGPFTNPSERTIYTFRADPESNLGAYLISTSLTVVIEAGATISHLQPTDIFIGTSPNSIRCYATGVPSPTIRWYKDSILITTSSSSNVYQRIDKTHAEFNAQKANISDAGKYTCVATNTIQGIKKSANSTAVVRAKVTLVNSSVTLPSSTSESLQLMCTLEGFPTPKIEWKFKREGNYQKIFPNHSGSVFRYQNQAEPANHPIRNSSQLYIPLSEYLGTIEVICSAWNEFENSSNEKAFQVNKDVAISAGKLYKLFGKIEKEKRNISGAEHFCYSTGSRLAKISGSETQASLKSMIDRTGFASNIYVGAKREIEDSCEIWRWKDNSLFYNETKHGKWMQDEGFVDGNYVAWHQGRPYYDVSCLVLRSDYQWEWTDAYCTSIIGFICESTIPDITKNFSATVDECSSNITLRWFTSAEAVGVLHRIDVIHEESNTTLQNWRTDVVSSHENLMSLRLLNLNYSTTYLIRMTVCPTECEHPFVTSRKIRTKALIASNILAIEAYVTKTTQNKSCLISWKVDATKYEILGFKIRAMSVLVYTAIEPNGPHIEELNAATDPNHVDFAYSFNRKYSFSIQAVTCTGHGPMFDVLGSCVTERGAPDVVHVPAIVKSTKDGDVGVTIRFPEESNGPISCLFLILAYKPYNTSNQWIKTFDDLVKLAKTEVNENEAYIAFAMTRSDISDAQSRTISKNLGDDTVSSCIVIANINAVRTKGEAATKIEIKGNNLKLEDGAEYSYFTISASPGDDNAVMLKFSNVSHFIKETATTEESTNTTIAITVTCIGIIIVAVLLVFWIIRRKRNSNKKIKSATQQRSGDAPAISPYETTFISSVASSSSKQIQPESPYTYENDATCYEEPMSTIKKDENSRKTYENINPYETCDIKSDSDETKYEEVKPRR